MVNYKSKDSMILIRIINLAERLIKKIIKNKNIYVLDNFLADSLFINNLITSTEEVLIENQLIKNELRG